MKNTNLFSLNKSFLLGAAFITIATACNSQALDTNILNTTVKNSNTEACTLSTGVPNYRVFRGVKRDDISSANFIQDLQKRFIPAAPNTHVKNGLVAYLPALPPKNKNSDIADEFAIVIYESEDVYKMARNSPEGIIYSDLHWELFNKDLSKSGSAVKIESTNNILVSGTPYDLMQKPTDWQCGYSTFYIGKRLDNINPRNFLLNLTKHVLNVKSSFSTMGLEAYIVVVNENYEFAFMNWKSKSSYNSAMSSEQGKTIANQAAKLIKSVQFTSAIPFNGTINDGQFVNVKFKKRK